MCNIWKKEPGRDELSVEDLDNFFKRANKFSWVGITGGEPFLRPDLTDIIDVVSKYCRNLSAIHFATNGQLKEKILGVTDYIRRKNKRLKVVYTVSIDGPPSLHDEIRGVPGTWNRAVDTFKTLKNDGFAKAQIGFTLSPHNMGRFGDAFNALKETHPKLSFDDMTVNIFQKSSFYYENVDMQEFDKARLRSEIKKILEMDKDRFSVNNFLRRKYLRLYLKYMDTHKCPLKCQALSSTCFLDPYGNLFPCAVYNKKLLNIKDMKDELANIWNKDYAKKLSRECSHHACPSCWSPCDAYSAIGSSLKQALCA